MEELTPVGLSRDGSRLILVNDRGEEYAVPYDHRLRTALRGETGRFGQLEMKMESTLRPRDIQNRIRAGESAEEVAAAAGTTADKIMGFAGPVLAERAHIAESAQASSIRRPSGESSGARVLSESALAHLRVVGIKFEEVAWDAWRREDGRWLVVADYVAAHQPHHAEFVYDVRGRYVVADNDEARLLTGEARIAEPAQPGHSARRLSAVPSAQDELPLGDDAIELVREGGELTADHGDADWIAPREDAPLRHPDPAEETAAGASQSPAAAPAAGSGDPTGDTGSDTGSDTDEEPTVEVARPAKRKGRSSVPSWDEIMFGGGPNE